MRNRPLILTLALCGVLLCRSGPAAAKEIPEAVDGAVAVASAVSSFFFPIFGQCLEVAAAIHLGGAHVVKGLSNSTYQIGQTYKAERDAVLSCVPPVIPEESFSSCPAWPAQVPPGVVTLLNQIVLDEVDLIEDDRAVDASVGPYFGALNAHDMACANTLYSFMQSKVSDLNSLASQLTSLYSNAATQMRASVTDTPQPIANFNNFMNSLRTSGYPAADLAAMAQIHATPDESNTYLDIVNNYTNAQILQLAGFPGATQLKFSDGLQAGANAYAAYHPTLEFPPPTLPAPAASGTGIAIVSGLLAVAGALALRRRMGPAAE